MVGVDVGFGVEHGTLLFEVPIYRVSPAGWHTEVEGTIEKYRQQSIYTEPQKRDEYAYRMAELERGYGPATYNQVIAWVRVVWDGPGPVIKFYLYRVKQKRIMRNFKPERYEWQGKTAELWFTPDQSSSEIAAEVRAELEKLTDKGADFAGRCVDMEAFDAIAPNLDWQRLLQLGT